MQILNYTFTTLLAFTFMPLANRYYLRQHGPAPLYRSFVPLFLLGTTLASFTTSTLISHNPITPPSPPLEILGLGILYACATYLLYYALEHERAGIVSALGGAQQLLIALLSSLIFAPTLLERTSWTTALMLIGVIALTARRRPSGFNLSKYALIALTANLLWVAMWLIIYATIPSPNVPTLFSLIVSVALACSLVASYFLKVKRVEIDYLVKPSKKLTPILASSILNGLGSATYAVSYTLQPVITPLIVEMYIPAVIVLGSLFLREKLYNTELIGSTIILASIFAYILL